jgi:APA family basic amino acid/polyamine antiporter
MLLGMTGSPPQRVFGFWICLALVVGNMIGSGVYLIPGTLAPFGWNGVLGWLATIAGALCLAAVLGALSRAFPKAGGPYAYAREAFGPFAGFLIAWSYWASLWVGNVAVATGVVAPLTTIVPGLTPWSPVATMGLLWGITGLNCWGAGATGRLQLVTTILKFVPLLAVILIAGLVIGRGGAAILPPLRPADLHLLGGTGISAAAAVTLWTFLGIESATIPAERVADPRRTIPRATLAGTAITGLVYLFACSSVALLLPAAEAAKSGAPIADFVARYWGPAAGTAMALFAAITAFGALNGWILLQGEVPWAMAKDGALPAWLAKLSRRGTPVRAHLVSSVLLTLVMTTTFARSLTELFKFLILLGTVASLVPYLVCALALLRLRARARMPATGAVILVAVLAALYSIWAILGAGNEAMGWGAALLASGAPVWLLMRKGRVGAAKPAPLVGPPVSP